MSQDNKNIESIYNSQKEFFGSGKTKSIEFRIDQLRKLKFALKKFKKEIYAALKADLNKPEFEAYITEIYLVKKEIEHAIKNIECWTKPEKVKTPITLYGSKSYTIPEPYGLTLIISPWNYPITLSLIPMVGAIAAGNCVILKPSELSVNSSKILKKIIEEVFQENYVCVIEGDHEVAQKILSLKFDYIFFTGSTNVGKIVMEAAAENLTPLTLELGGKSPCIVDIDVNIKSSARKIAWGKFINAGQTCIAPDYILVHEDIKDELVLEIKNSITKFFGSNPKSSPDYCKIINEKNFDRLEKIITEPYSYCNHEEKHSPARPECFFVEKMYRGNEGNSSNTGLGNIIFGGDIDRANLYISPTLITNNNNQEIFGPILPIITYKNITQAIEYINNNPKPLALYIFSENKETQELIINNTSSGGVCINDTLSHIGSVYLPFGGVGQSGFGRYHGKASFDSFSNYKSVLKSGSFEVPFKYPPYKIGSKILKFFLDKIF